MHFVPPFATSIFRRPCEFIKSLALSVLSCKLELKIVEIILIFRFRPNTGVESLHVMIHTF